MSWQLLIYQEGIPTLTDRRQSYPSTVFSVTSRRHLHRESRPCFSSAVRYHSRPPFFPLLLVNIIEGTTLEMHIVKADSPTRHIRIHQNVLFSKDTFQSPEFPRFGWMQSVLPFVHGDCSGVGHRGGSLLVLVGMRDEFDCAMLRGIAQSQLLPSHG